MNITQCRVNHMENPIGYQYRKLTFSWVTDSDENVQSRIVVRSEGENIEDTGWKYLDSVAAALELKLEPRTRYEWQVSVRSENGDIAESEWSFFETGKMEEQWKGQWITTIGKNDRHPVFFHKIPDTKGRNVKWARLYICGLGLYEAYIDDEKIADEYLTPGFTSYNLWVQAQTYDVSSMLRKGGKELSVLVGDGWYKSRMPFEGSTHGYYGDDYRILAELYIKYEDGSEDMLFTDETWSVKRSNITYSGIYDGECQDDTLPDAKEEPVTKAEPLNARLVDRLSLPVKTHEEFHPCLVQNEAGETLLDIGQNLAGTFVIKVDIPKGKRLRIQAGEVLQDGRFYRDNLRSAKAEFNYISDGQPHVLRPHFTFYGFRYLKIDGVDDFNPKDITVYALYSDMPMNSEIITGHAKLNQFLSNVKWGMKSNFVDVPTDCPQRDERMGWTGDAQVFSETACFIAQPYAFYRKYLYDMEQEQKAAGGCAPDFVPAPTCSGRGTSAWGDSTTVIPWNMYLYTGDISILSEHFDSMCSWVDYIQKIDGENHGWRKQFHYGDWLALDCPYEGTGQVRGGTDEGFIADAYYRKSAIIVAKTARLLGKKKEAEHYEELSETILKGMAEEFYSPNGRCCINTQTAALLTLHEGLNSPDRAVSQLLSLLKNSDDKLRTGFVGTPLLCQVLADIGQEKLADRILLNEEYPGWLHEVNMGATTVWERWNSIDETGHMSSTGMNSLNHYAYGAVVAYIWKYLVGLNVTEDAPGFRRVKIAPHVNYSIGHINAVYPSPVGEYRIEWEVKDMNHIHMQVTVPPQAEAEVLLPLDKENRKFCINGKDGGKDIEICKGTLDILYETVTPVGVRRSIDEPLSELVCSERCRALIKKTVSDLDWMLGFGRDYPLLETMKNRGYTTRQIENLRQELNMVIE